MLNDEKTEAGRRQKSRDKYRPRWTSIVGFIPIVLSKHPERVHQVFLRGTEEVNFGE